MGLIGCLHGNSMHSCMHIYIYIYMVWSKFLNVDFHVLFDAGTIALFIHPNMDRYIKIDNVTWCFIIDQRLQPYTCGYVCVTHQVTARHIAFASRSMQVACLGPPHPSQIFGRWRCMYVQTRSHMHTAGSVEVWPLQLVHQIKDLAVGNHTN